MSEQFVRLTMPVVDAVTPEDAVRQFINKIVEDGLNCWLYRVDMDGRTVFIDGYGKVYDVQAVADGAGGEVTDDNLIDLAKELLDRAQEQ